MSPGSVEPLRAADRLFELLGVRVSTHHAVADPVFVDGLWAEELRAVDRAVESRRHEFACARACARASMATLGIDPASIPVRPDRSPMWPRQTIGSITHTEGICMAAVAAGPSSTSTSIGLDAEVVGRVTGEVAGIALTTEERQWVASTDRPDVMATVVFAVKEALYKAQSPVTGSWLDFTDVRASATEQPGIVRLDLIDGDAAVRHLSWPLTAAWTLLDVDGGIELVIAAVAL